MSEPVCTLELSLSPPDNRRLLSICGRLDENIRYIEKRLGIEIINRSTNFQFIGKMAAINIAANVLQTLYKTTTQQTDISYEEVHLVVAQFSGDTPGIESKTEHIIKTKKGETKTRTLNQQKYVKNIMSHDVNFGVGPAGTGKTFIAVACAVQALEQEKVRRIILVRPAVEAGEHLGFLPGDLAQKIDPYLRPLYDALYELLGAEKVSKLIERNIIEIASLAYMRGRTLNDAFIILDESQNTTPEQMKMFLTRIGFSSTTVITGDITQTDLPKGKQSGLKQVLGILKDIPNISFTFFNANDVVRHPVVQQIIKAYEVFEAKEQS